MTDFKLIINGTQYKAINLNLDLSAIQLSNNEWQVVEDSFQFVLFTGTLAECTNFAEKA